MTDWNKLEVEEIVPKDRAAVVYRLSGVLTNTPESYAFLEKVREGVRKGNARVVINLQKVDHVTSAGVGILAACFTSVANAGGKLGLASVPGRAEAILKVVRFLDVVPCSATEAEAIRALAP